MHNIFQESLRSGIIKKETLEEKGDVWWMKETKKLRPNIFISLYSTTQFKHFEAHNPSLSSCPGQHQHVPTSPVGWWRVLRRPYSQHHHTWSTGKSSTGRLASVSTKTSYWFHAVSCDGVNQWSKSTGWHRFLLLNWRVKNAIPSSRNHPPRTAHSHPADRVDLAHSLLAVLGAHKGNKTLRLDTEGRWLSWVLATSFYNVMKP